MSLKKLLNYIINDKINMFIIGLGEDKYNLSIKNNIKIDK